MLVANLCLILCDPMDCSPPGSPVHGDFPGKNTGVGHHSLLQGIFLTQGSNPGAPALWVDSLPSEPPGKPQTLLWGEKKEKKKIDREVFYSHV